jgi:hypothetical protein
MLSIGDCKLIKTYVFAISLVCFGCLFSHPVSADPLDKWHWINPLPQGNSLKGVTYGNGLFVAVGAYGTILISSDGSTWTVTIPNTTNNLNTVAYGNGFFIAVGENGAILTSSDGRVWRLKDSGTTQYLNGITYGDGTFVVVGGIPPNPGIILTSNDGEVWKEQTYPTRGPFWGVAYGNSTFVTVGGDFIHIMPNTYYHGIILASSDGATWTNASEFTDRWVTGVTYGNGTFVAWQEGYVATPLIFSSDGFTWTGTDSTGSETVEAAAFGFGTFVAVGKKLTDTGAATGIIQTSPNGATWTERNVTGAELLNGIAYGDGTFIAVGESGKILQSDPLEVEIQSPPNGTHFSGCSQDASVTFSWREQEVFARYEIQFSSDQDFASIATKVKTSATSTTIKQSSWKRMLPLLDGKGGVVYWRVTGIQSNGTITLSEVRSIIIDPQEAVGAPAITSTAKGSLPELSWQINCNTKFKVWFGNDVNFTKKAGFSFNIKDPSVEGFSKTLTAGQWTAIKRLAKNVAGSIIYWYIESWDELGRYAKTDVMSFVLTD